ncbi:MAG: hypothetical protein SFW09_13390 [Hyphomicrobiaceae bacterium]|nr:hypothetical protein [Hyphomicrobiaceae bacterium]
MIDDLPNPLLLDVPPPPAPIRGGRANFRVDPAYAEKQANQRSDAEIDRALKVLDMATRCRSAQTDTEILMLAERMWQWAVTDTWPFSGDPSQGVGSEPG